MVARGVKGAKALVLKVLARLVYRRVVLVARELHSLWLEPASDIPLRVRRLQRSDVTAYVEFRQKQPQEEVLRRLDEGSFCYVTWTGERISSAVWYQSGLAWIPEIDRHLPLGREDVYAYDSWTAPELRGHNIAAVRGEQTHRLLRAAGYKRLVGYVLPENPAGFRPIEKLGLERTGTLGYLQLGPARLEFSRVGKSKTKWRLRRSPRLPFRRPVLRPS